MALALGADAHDVPGQPRPLEARDDQGRRVELPAAQTVRGGRGEGVVVVVPGLAEGQRRQPGQVARLVAGVEVAPAEEVAQRVDRERHVVQDEDAHRTAPQQTGEPARDGLRERHAEAEGQRQTERGPQQEGAIDEVHDGIADQVGGVALLAGEVRAEQPSEMSVGQAAQRAAPAAGVTDVRAVRVAVLVGEGVVLAVVGDPFDDRSLRAPPIP